VFVSTSAVRTTPDDRRRPPRLGRFTLLADVTRGGVRPSGPICAASRPLPAEPGGTVAVTLQQAKTDPHAARPAISDASIRPRPRARPPPARSMWANRVVAGDMMARRRIFVRNGASLSRRQPALAFTREGPRGRQGRSERPRVEGRGGARQKLLAEDREGRPDESLGLSSVTPVWLEGFGPSARGRTTARGLAVHALRVRLAKPLRDAAGGGRASLGTPHRLVNSCYPRGKRTPGAAS